MSAHSAESDEPKADLTICRQVLPGWAANISYEEGVRRTLDWFCDQIKNGAHTDALTLVRLEE